jgi:hypothetical protein
VKWAFLNKHVQSRLKPTCAFVVEMWKVLIPICRVLQLWKRDARDLKGYHIQQSSNVKLFGALRRKKTARELTETEKIKHAAPSEVA